MDSSVTSCRCRPARVGILGSSVQRSTRTAARESFEEAQARRSLSAVNGSLLAVRLAHALLTRVLSVIPVDSPRSAGLSAPFYSPRWSCLPHAHLTGLASNDEGYTRPLLAARVAPPLPTARLIATGLAARGGRTTHGRVDSRPAGSAPKHMEVAPASRDSQAGMTVPNRPWSSLGGDVALGWDRGARRLFRMEWRARIGGGNQAPLVLFTACGGSGGVGRGGRGNSSTSAARALRAASLLLRLVRKCPGLEPVLWPSAVEEGSHSGRHHSRAGGAAARDASRLTAGSWKKPDELGFVVREKVAGPASKTTRGRPGCGEGGPRSEGG